MVKAIGEICLQELEYLDVVKSCRLRWVNYLRPEIKRGNISSDEEDLIIRLHSLLRNRWALIAKRLPGRTDNEIKNCWNCRLSRRVETSRVVKKIPSSQSTAEKKNKDSAANEDTLNTKIYIPKAVRVSPYSIAIENVVGFDTMESTRSSSPCHGEGNIIRPHDTEEPLRSRSDLIEKAAAAKVHIEEYGLANEIDNSFLDFLPIEDNIKLDEIIAEYEKLVSSENNVQFDSLADTFSV